MEGTKLTPGKYRFVFARRGEADVSAVVGQQIHRWESYYGMKDKRSLTQEAAAIQFKQFIN